MKKAVVIGVGLWLAAASVVAIVWSPTPTLRQVSVVYQIWFWSFVASWLIGVAMAGLCGLTLRQLASRDDKWRGMVALGARNPWFWPLYWLSLLATVINTVAPLFLFVFVPLWTAVIGNAVNLFLSAGAPFVRVWIWRAAHEKDQARNELPA